MGARYGTFAGLCDAANDGCPICKRLRLRFIERGMNDLDAWVFGWIPKVNRPDEFDKVFVDFHSESDEFKDVGVNLELVPVRHGEGTTA